MLTSDVHYPIQRGETGILSFSPKFQYEKTTGHHRSLTRHKEPSIPCVPATRRGPGAQRARRLIGRPPPSILPHLFPPYRPRSFIPPRLPGPQSAADGHLETVIKILLRELLRDETAAGRIGNTNPKETLTNLQRYKPRKYYPSEFPIFLQFCADPICKNVISQYFRYNFLWH